MSTRDDVAAIVPFTKAFRELGIEYYIGGSVASSTHGISRSTADIGLIATVHLKHVAQLVNLLQDAYYIDESMIRQAIHQQRSFNVIHLETMYKLDVFAPKTRSFDQSAWSRRVLARPFEDHEEQYPVASPEDTILSKFEWYKAGGGTSERQCDDVIGVMRIQFDQLDQAYLNRWAADLGVSDLLQRAWTEARTLMDEHVE